MKGLVVAAFLLAPALALETSATQYWLGYSESIVALGWSDLFCDLLVGVFLFLLVLGIFFLALWEKVWRLQATVAVLAFWPVAFGTFELMPPGATMIVHGLRDRVLHDCSLDDLRRFAHEVNDNHLLVGGFINHGEISNLPSEQQAAFHRLQEHFPFMRWLNDGRILTGPSLINYQDDNVVNFEWGGALIGHWGCSIRLDGKRSDPPPGMFFRTLRASDDIYFYFE